MSRPRFGLLDKQFVEQLGHLIVDVFASVIGVKSQNLKGKLRQYRLQYREQVRLTDLRHRAHYLPLRHLIDSVDVVHTLGPIQIALMYGIDADVPRSAIGLGTAPLAD